jgi:hypothetical protein
MDSTFNIRNLSREVLESMAFYKAFATLAFTLKALEIDT